MTTLRIVALNTDKVIQAIKEVRLLSGLGLKDAKEVADRARGFTVTGAKVVPAQPSEIQVIEYSADDAVRRLEAVGFTVERVGCPPGDLALFTDRLAAYADVMPAGATLDDLLAVLRITQQVFFDA